ncbi:MAG: DUF4834 family protein [Prevotella sp.]
MIGALLNLIFLVFVFFVVIAIVVAYRIVKSFMDVKKTFFSKRNKGFYGNRAADKDDVVIDNRSPEDVKKKIFDKNEGEYVDFEED